MIVASETPKSTPDTYVLRITGPKCLEVELDHEGFADRYDAARIALSVAFHLAEGSGPLGPPELVLDALDTLAALEVDPLGCNVDVVALQVGSTCGLPRGIVVHRESVAGYATSPQFAAAMEGFR